MNLFDRIMGPFAVVAMIGAGAEIVRSASGASQAWMIVGGAALCALGINLAPFAWRRSKEGAAIARQRRLQTEAHIRKSASGSAVGID